MEISQLKILEFIHVLIFQAQEGRVSLCGCPMSLQKIHNHRKAPLALVDAKQNVLSDLHELQQENSLSIWLDVDIGQVWMTAIGETSKSLCMNSVSWFTSSQPYQNACFTPNYVRHSSSISECMLTHMHGKYSSTWRITLSAVDVD